MVRVLEVHWISPPTCQRDALQQPDDGTLLAVVLADLLELDVRVLLVQGSAWLLVARVVVLPIMRQHARRYPHRLQPRLRIPVPPPCGP